jgi:hypothetical protein
MKLGAILPFALIAFSDVASAAPPAELHRKSVLVQWSETRMQRRADQDEFRAVAASGRLQIYFSEAGRVFSRLSFSTRRGSGSNEQVAGSAGAKRVPVFSGRAMTMYLPTGGGGGIRRVSVDFDGAYGSCTGTVVAAKEHGAQIMVGRSLINGSTVYMQSITASGTSCSVQPGNVFAGQ